MSGQRIVCMFCLFGLRLNGPDNNFLATSGWTRGRTCPGTQTLHNHLLFSIVGAARTQTLHNQLLFFFYRRSRHFLEFTSVARLCVLL